MFKKILGIFPKLIGWFLHTSWKKRLLIIGIIIVIVGIVGSRVMSGKNKGYVLDTVQRHTITETVSESGLITANGRVNVYSPTTGIVGEVFVANEEKVEEGQKLFTVKSTATPQEKAAAYATYQSAIAAVQQAENIRRSTSATVDRVHDDLKDKDSTETFLQKETRTAAEVANDNAYDSLLAARAQLNSARVAYQASQNSAVTAVVSGIVSNLSVVTGSNVTANSVLSSSSPVLIIGGLGTTEIVISVGERDINKIKVNQPANIKLDAIPDKKFTGVVKRVDENGTLVQGVVKFGVYIEVSDIGDSLKPGMTADVDITTSSLTDVLAVPNSAVKPYQKGRAVRQLKNGELEFVPVKIGVRGKEYTQILEGINEGQEIVISLTNEKAARTSPFGF